MFARTARNKTLFTQFKLGLQLVIPKMISGLNILTKTNGLIPLFWVKDSKFLHFALLLGSCHFCQFALWPKCIEI
jgi:hypothetical protein